MREDLAKLYSFAGNRRTLIARAVGVHPRSVAKWVEGIRTPTPEHLKAFTSACLAVGLELGAKQRGLAGGHELIGVRRDVFRRYLRGTRRMAPSRAVHVAVQAELPLPGYRVEVPEVEEAEAVEEIEWLMPYAEFVEYRAAGRVQEPPGMDAEIREMRRARGSNFALSIRGTWDGFTLIVEDYGIRTL